MCVLQIELGVVYLSLSHSTENRKELRSAWDPGVGVARGRLSAATLIVHLVTRCQLPLVPSGSS